MKTPTLPDLPSALKPPREEDFGSRLRSPAVAARIGLWLGISFGICFITGLISHYAQNHSQPIPFPTSPSWGYRITQGLHVTSGTAAVPLLLVKLWAVYPKLFAKPDLRLRKLVVEVFERGSIGVLVASSIFQLATGLANSAQWYPWDFSFRTSHYALGWVAIGALIVHIAVKLPIIRDALTGHVEDTAHDRDSAVHHGPIGRRGLLRITWAASGIAILATAGSTVPALRKVSIFATRTGEGPEDIPINKSSRAAGVTTTAVSPAYALTVALGDREVSLSRDDLLAMPQRTHHLPIACVEGWSAAGDWAGVRLRDLLDLVDAPRDRDVQIVSLQQTGPYRETLLQGNFADDDRTLIALGLNGETLSLEHGYPCRLIAPNRPGVLQTKWVTRVEVDA